MSLEETREKYSKRVFDIFMEGVKIKEQFYQENIDKILYVINTIIATFKISKGKILVFGNGGSAADAQHIAGEFVNRFLIDRPALPAMALTTDTSVLTAIGNDINYDQIFSRQIEAHASFGDVCIGISTSGNSQNVLNGLKSSIDKGANTISFLGCDGGRIAKELDYITNIIVPSWSTPRIQEIHITLAHIICEIVEDILFNN